MALRDKITTTGKWAFIISLMLVFSIKAEYRVSILGLLVHPYLLVLPLALVFSGLNIFAIPARVLQPLIAFLIIFSLANLRNNSPFSEAFKVLASLVTFLYFAVSIKTEKDFRTVAWGFIFCALAIGIQSVLIGDAGEVSRLKGINALEGLGNKNAQSLFTLPAIFLAILLVLRYLQERRFLFLIFLLATLFVITISLFLSANRSGWVGLAVIYLVYIVYIGRSLRLITVTAIMGVFVYVAVNQFAKDIVQHKQEQTEIGYSSDEGRQMLALAAFQVGIENPLIGVGMDELHRQMAASILRDTSRIKLMDTHILWGFLFGAAGVFCLLSFLYFLYSLTYPYGGPWPRLFRKEIGKMRLLMAGFVVLFFVRALFTREILYSPTFMGAMGLLFGYYLLQIRNAFEATRK